MTKYLPIVLKGENLGKRHSYLNSLVNQAYKENVDFSTIRSFPEQSPVDRLFKIELASKYKNVEYILENLKDRDMLYVSKAMQVWLLDPDYVNIVNPAYLENTLYPQMTTTGVSKFKHLIQHNLKDSKRCYDFFQFYKEKNINHSLKFLPNCSKEIIFSEIENLWDLMTPFLLKLLAEKCPEIAKMFYNKLYEVKGENKLITNYLKNENKYYEGLKFLLKVNGDIFLDITEKCFNLYNFRRFTVEATKTVMKEHRNRFENKPELYTAWLLDIRTLAQYLNANEIKELIFKLARADYLSWFVYKNVEPLIKKLDVKERSAFKKQVFVDKSFGDKVVKWPYDAPSPPITKSEGNSIFADKKHNPFEYEYLEDFDLCYKKRCKRRSAKYCDYKECAMLCSARIKRKTSLEQLFDRFRFVGFEKTLFDLRKQIKAETMPHRQNIMLVLVSKSGSRVECLEKILKLFITGHENEPENLRATIVRSLVRRSCAWRLPDDLWEMLLKFGRGLGLDGTPSTVACSEGLHAVILRSILLDTGINEAVWKAFLKDFSTLKEYSLTVEEKSTLATRLPSLLLILAKNDPTKTIECIEKTLQFLNAYNIKVDKHPELIQTVKTVANDKEANCLLRWLFGEKMARKELFKENFALIKTNACYLNALKHDPSILVPGNKFVNIIKENKLAHDGFLRNLALYFNEKDGLAETYLDLLMKPTEKWPRRRVARSVAILAGDKIVDITNKYDDAPKKSAERLFGIMLKANIHLSRPLIALEVSEWKAMGAKAVANRVLTCPTIEVDSYIEKLLTWNKTQRLAFVLSLRVGKESSVLTTINEKRPKLALKIGLLHSARNKFDDIIWDIIIAAIEKLDPSNIKTDFKTMLSNIDVVPQNKKGVYCTAVYEIFSKISPYAHIPILCNIENLLTDVKDDFIETAIKEFLNNQFTPTKFVDEYGYSNCVYLRLRIIVKYLLLCKTEEEQKRKWLAVGKPLFDRIEEIWQHTKEKSNILLCIQKFIKYLKYNKVFLDTEYVSSLPIFELTINSLNKILPLHEYYEVYVHLHLSMLYFKTLRQAIKNNSVIFEDLPKNCTLASEIVGRMFGKYIAQEVSELTDQYFESIKIAYGRELLTYISINIAHGATKSLFLKNLVKGILDFENDKSHILAVFIHKEGSYINESDKKEMFETLNGSTNKEVQFFLWASDTQLKRFLR